MGNYKAIFLSIITAIASVTAYGHSSDQYIGTREPILDHFMQNVKNGSEVHVYAVYDGQIHLPNQNGESTSIYNQLLFKTTIGCGVDPALENTGKFSCVIKPKRIGVSFFVRVFSGSFYGDSQIYTIEESNAPIFVSINPAKQHFKEGSDYVDYVTRQQNEALIDSDGDGYSDLDEACANTNPQDANDFIQIYDLELIDGNIVFSWDARGPEYILEGTTNYIDSTNLVWEVLEVNSSGTAMITNDNQYLIFRLRVDCENER